MTQKPPIFGATVPMEKVASCLNLSVSDLRGDCPCQVVSTGAPFLIVPAQNKDVLGKVQMDRVALGELLDQVGVGTVFIFCLGGFAPGAETHARLLDPRGTSEDPYTGSATGAMGSYVFHHGLKQGITLVAEQGHFVHRPGLGVVEVAGTPERIESVRLGGAAVRVLEGKIFVQ